MAGPSKFVLATVLFFAAAFGARAAWAARRSGGTGLALASAFAGGALLNAGLVHLLADASREMSEGVEESYPVAELLCGLGALLTHLFETIGESLWPEAHGDVEDESHCENGDIGEAPDGEASFKDVADASLGLAAAAAATDQGRGAEAAAFPSSSSSSGRAPQKLGKTPQLLRPTWLSADRPQSRGSWGGGWKLCGIWQCIFPSLEAAVSDPGSRATPSGHHHDSKSAGALSPVKAQSLATAVPRVTGLGMASKSREAPYIVGNSYDEEDLISSGSPPHEGRHLVCSSSANGPSPCCSPEARRARKAERKRQSSHDAARGGPLAGPLLLLALSFHALLEGLSLGASGGGQAMSLFLAILLHKSVAAFSLGVTWLAGYDTQVLAAKRYIGAMLWFSSVTPLGIILATPLEGSSLGVWVQALSAGTFLYIGLVESCPGIRTPWLSDHRSKLWGARFVQLACYAAGFGCMGLLGAWT